MKASWMSLVAAALAASVSAAVEIPATNGVSFAAAFDAAARIRAHDLKTDIVINADFERIALSRPVRIDGAVQPEGAGTLVVRGVGKTRPRIQNGSGTRPM